MFVHGARFPVRCFSFVGYVTISRLRSGPYWRLGPRQPLSQDKRDIFVDRAGMGLLFLHAQFGQHVDNDARLDLKLSCQLVNSDFLHSGNCYITP